MTVRLVLASASPRRRELLELLDVPFEVCAADVDEVPILGEDATALVIRLAEAKALAVHEAGQITIGADTVVVVDDRVLGKPRDDTDAVAMLTALAGRAHRVISGVAIAGPDGAVDTFAEATTVWMAPIGPREIEAYVASGEPADKAGAYGIQGRGGRFVARIEGSYHNVVGLPVAQLAARLSLVGADEAGAR